MKDRVPTPGQEGRVKITPESGGAAYYAKMEMADNPTQAGDEPIKANLLPDAVATVLGLTGNPQVKDALEKIKTLVDGNTTLANSKAKIATGGYVGTGTYGSANPCSLSFDFVPRCVMVFNPDRGFEFNDGFKRCFIWAYGITRNDVYGTSDATMYYSVESQGLVWYANQPAGQCNTADESYKYLALG